VPLKSKDHREIELVKNAGHPPPFQQVRESATAADTESCLCEMICMKKGASSGSLPPVVSMMQTTEARE